MTRHSRPKDDPQSPHTDELPSRGIEPAPAPSRSPDRGMSPPRRRHSRRSDEGQLASMLRSNNWKIWKLLRGQALIMNARRCPRIERSAQQ